MLIDPYNYSGFKCIFQIRSIGIDFHHIEDWKANEDSRFTKI